jgi:signal peptide peptidase SppA
MVSPDSGYLPEKDTIVSRVRDVARNNGWASGALQKYVDGAVGSDFRLSYKPDYQALGLSAKWARQFSKEVEAKFRAWANDSRNYCDASEKLDFGGLVGLAFRHRMADGECVLLSHWIKRGNFPYSTALQVVHPDRLCSPLGKLDDENFKAGIEFNKFGAPKAYWFSKNHPAENESFVYKKIPKQMAHGRRLVIHYFEADEAGQSRGKPLFTSIVEKLKMLDKYEQTELQAALLNAVLAAFIESPFDHDDLDDALDDDSVSGILLNFDSSGGVVNGAFDLADKIRHARETKAIWAIADEQAYSAAYLLASQVSKLFVPRTGGVGSIGVITIHFDYSQYFQNEGISPTVLRAGEQKARGNPYEPLSDAFKANKINELEELIKLFANTVSIGRGSISSDEILKTEAACFTADEALKMGLVDEVACFDEVLGKFVQHINNSEKGKVLMSEKDLEKEEKVEASTQVSASSEKERIKAILSSEEAKGREKLANHIAFDTGMGIDEAKSMLCNAPQASEKPKLDAVMSGYDASIGDGSFFVI